MNIRELSNSAQRPRRVFYRMYPLVFSEVVEVMLRQIRKSEHMRIEEIPRTGRVVGKLIFLNRPSPDTNRNPPNAAPNPSWRLAIDKAMRVNDPAVALPLVHAAEMAL